MTAEIIAPVINPTKELLMSLATPDKTRTYKPVSHKELIETTLESIDKCGFSLTRELYSHGREGMIANGKYHLAYGEDPDMGLMVAWQNSYDKSLSLKFAVGGFVFICANGMVKGDMGTYKSKHVGDVQQITPATLREYICSAGDTFHKMVIEKQRMKEIEVTKRVSAELIGRMYIEEGIITSTQMNIIKKEMKDPSYEYGCDGSLWQLYNHHTHSLKESSPQFWMSQQISAHKFYTKEFSIVA